MQAFAAKGRDLKRKPQEKDRLEDLLGNYSAVHINYTMRNLECFFPLRSTMENLVTFEEEADG